MVKTLDFGVSPGYLLVKSQSIAILDGNFPAFLAAPTPRFTVAWHPCRVVQEARSLSGQGRGILLGV